jgi:hypothetical protein
MEKSSFCYLPIDTVGEYDYNIYIARSICRFAARAMADYNHHFFVMMVIIESVVITTKELTSCKYTRTTPPPLK